MLARTPLILASALGHYDQVQILLECKADVDAADKLGHTALHAAVRFLNQFQIDLFDTWKYNEKGDGTCV